ncbi:ATP-binding protein [Galbibacter sp. BG1]|uniref:AAA family ATPase n=1 Tax=Galbibacter sp. BG1 TaxID=1170699 RepID=UPI0015BB0D23|nr:ATP-binding protein [Galbibacter sp. BG1]QLE02226.1 ATP-binding protein [Galbibacter sp. BG1]
MNTNKKIVITGGPGTGKTSVIDFLKNEGYQCLLEISRQVTLEARADGIEQLFLTDPLLFSKKLLEGRMQQHRQSEALTGTVFFDRGVPDVLAYMDYSGDSYPEYFEEACQKHRYDRVFLLPPWEDIYTSDNERYENFAQAREIHKFLEQAYLRAGYDLQEVPTGTVEERAHFILKNIH